MKAAPFLKETGSFAAFKSFKFFQGQTIAIEIFARSLIELGYAPHEKVQEEGDFSRRGGILDVYPATFEYPVRIEWEDEKILSIDSFSLTTGKPFWNHKIVILLPKKAQTAYRSLNITQEIPLDSFWNKPLIPHQNPCLMQGPIQLCLNLLYFQQI